VELFNKLNNEKIQHDFDAKVTEAALSGHDTGFIPRADQTGYQRIREIKETEEEEKEEEEFQLLIMAITELNIHINEGLVSIAETIEELYDLAEKILDDINDIHDQIKKIQETHSKALHALRNRDDNISESGTIENKTLQKMADNYCKRTGKDLPQNSNALNIVINEQMKYEQSVLIPWLETRSEALVQLHDRVLTGALEISQEHKSLSNKQDQINDLPQSEEMVKQLNELDKAVEVQRNEAEHINASTQEEKAAIEKEIEAVRVSHDVSSAELKEKARDLEIMDDLSFSPQSIQIPSKAPQPGH